MPVPTCSYYIAKTFAHLAGAVLITSLGAKSTITFDIVKWMDLPPVARSIMSLVYVAVVLVLPAVFMSMSAVNPYKYAIGAVWVFLIGQMLQPLVESLDDREILFRTLVLTGGVFLGMVAVGLFDNQNLLGIGPYLFGALLGLIVAQIALMAAKMTGAKGLQSIESVVPFFGIGLFSLFTAYDTQVLKQRARTCRGIPDYVNESVRFLLDFVNLFTGVANAQV